MTSVRLSQRGITLELDRVHLPRPAEEPSSEVRFRITSTGIRDGDRVLVRLHPEGGATRDVSLHPQRAGLERPPTPDGPRRVFEATLSDAPHDRCVAYEFVVRRGREEIVFTPPEGSWSFRYVAPGFSRSVRAPAALAVARLDATEVARPATRVDAPEVARPAGGGTISISSLDRPSPRSEESRSPAPEPTPPRIDRAGDLRSIRGRLLLPKDTAAAGVRVDLFGDEARESAIGRGVTDRSGTFHADIPESAGTRVWARASVEGADARTPILGPWTSTSTGVHELFAIRLPSRRSAQAGRRHAVTVLHEDGTTPDAGRYRVALVERTARTCVVHDLANVPGEGKVDLRLDPELRLTDADPHLFVRILLADGEPLVDSASFDVRLPLRFATKNPEIERVRKAIAAAGVPASELTDDDIAYVARRTGLAPELARALRDATALAADLKTSPEATYAWIRGASRGARAGDVELALAKARDGNLAPPPSGEDAETFAKAVDTLRAEAALGSTGRFNGADLDTVLQRRIPDAAARARFATTYRSRGADFWEGWQTTLGEEATRALRFTTEVARLTDHAGAVRALEAAYDRGAIKGTSDLATWSPARWEAFLKAAGVKAPGAFNTLAGNDAEGLILYGHRLAFDLAASEPTAAVRAAMEADLAAFPDWVRPVLPFLQQRKDYPVHVAPWSAEVPPGTFDAGPGESALKGLKAIHRLLRLQVSPWQLSRFLDYGFASARAIARRSPAAFVRAISPDFAGASALLAIHDRAVAVSAKAAILRANMGRGQYAPGLAVIGSPVTVVANTKPHLLVTWDTLFGDADRARCACKVCRSIYSPASYLVSLLEMIDAHPKDTGCSKQGSSSGGKPNFPSLMDLFLDRRTIDQNEEARRPDVLALPLTCESTNIEVPQIDLVNELLEGRVAPVGAGASCGEGTRGTSEERRAEPQSSPRSTVTDELARASFPWTLPYSFSHDRAHTGLENLDLWLPDVRDVVDDLRKAGEVPPAGEAEGARKVPSLYAPVGTAARAADDALDKARAKDILALAGDEWSILTTPATDPASAQAYWPQIASPQPAIEARALMEMSGLTYRDVFVLVATRFVRGSWVCADPSAVKFVGTPEDTCAVDQIKVTGLSWEILDRLHRFVRLMRRARLTIDDLDDLLLVLGATGNGSSKPDDGTVIAVAHVVAIQRRTKLPLVELLPLFGDVPRHRPCRTPLDDETLRSPFEKVFGRAPEAITRSLAHVEKDLRPEAAAKILAGLAQIDRADLRYLGDAVLEMPIIHWTPAHAGDDLEDWLGAAMQGYANVVTLASATRRVALLAEITGLEVLDVLALWRLSGLDVLPASANGRPDLPVLVWRFLRFVDARRSSSSTPQEMARICLPAWFAEAGGKDLSLGTDLVVLNRTFDGIEAALPTMDVVSREALHGLLAAVGVEPADQRGGDNAAAGGLIATLEAAAFVRTNPSLAALLVPVGLASFAPAVVDALAFSSRPQPRSAADLASGIADALAPLLPLSYLPVAWAMPTALQVAAEGLFPWPPDVALPPSWSTSAEERQRAFVEAIEAVVVSGVADRAVSPGFGDERTASAYAAPVWTRLVDLTLTTEELVAAVQQAIDAVDAQLKKNALQVTAAAEARIVVDRFTENLSGCVAAAGSAVTQAIEEAGQACRAYFYERLRVHLRRERREAAVIRWVAERVDLDQDRTSVLLRTLLEDPASPNRPILDAFLAGDGDLIRRSVIVARYANASSTPSAKAVIATNFEPSLDLEWGGKPPVAGISADAFEATLTMKGVTLAQGETISVRSSRGLTDAAVTVPPSAQGAAVVTLPASTTSGWADVISVAQAGTFDIELKLAAPPASTAAPAAPKIEVRRKNGSPLVSDARRKLTELVHLVERAALAMRAFPFLTAADWPKLSADPAAPRVALRDLPRTPQDESWLVPYLRLSAMRALHESGAGEAPVWSSFLAARISDARPELDLWRTVQDLTEIEARIQRRMFAEACRMFPSPVLGPEPFDELALDAGRCLAEKAEDAGVAPEALLLFVQAADKGGSDEALDALVLQALRSQTPRARALELLQAVHDPVRLRYRDALVTRAIVKETDRVRSTLEKPRYFDVISLNEYLLTDTQVSCCLTTSRVQFAYAAVQAFVERVLDHSIEPDGVAADFWKGALSLLDREWTWKKHYRLWEANMNLFLTPENWLGDETRGDETHAFRQLREVLRQGELTTLAAERALAAYLRELHAVGHLEIVATLTRDAECSPIPLGFRAPDITGTHVIGRTRSLPQRYFYRRRMPGPDARWLPWEPLDVDVEGDAFNLAAHDHRLYFLWATLRPGMAAQERVTAGGEDGENKAPVVKHEIRLHWIERHHGAWEGRASAPLAMKFDLRNIDWSGLGRSDITYDEALGRFVTVVEKGGYLELSQTQPQPRATKVALSALQLVLRSRSSSGRLLVQVCVGLGCQGGTSTSPDDGTPLYRYAAKDPSGASLVFLTTDRVLPNVPSWFGPLSYERVEGYVFREQRQGTIGLYRFSMSSANGAVWSYNTASDGRLIGYVPEVAPEGAVELEEASFATDAIQWTTYSTREEDLANLPKGSPSRRRVAYLLPAEGSATDAERLGFVGVGAFSIGPARDVTLVVSGAVSNLSYCGTTGTSNPDQCQYADGLGYLSAHGGQPFLLPLELQLKGGAADRKMREALKKMNRVYRIVMETAEGRAPTDKIPRFLDEIRPRTFEEAGFDAGKGGGTLRTFFCELVQTEQWRPGVNTGGHVDIDCMEKGLHILGEIGFGKGGASGGMSGGGVTDPGPAHFLFSPDRLNVLVSRADTMAIPRGPMMTKLLPRFTGMPGASIPGASIPGVNIPTIPDLPVGTHPGEVPRTPAGDIGGIGGMDIDLGQGFDPRQCIMGGLRGALATANIASMTRRTSFFLGSAEAAAADVLFYFLGPFGGTFQREECWKVSPFYHPFTSDLFAHLSTGATPGVLGFANESAGANGIPFGWDYQAQENVVTDFAQKEILDFSDVSAFGDYNWELFYHAPMLVAARMAQLGQFEDARRWFNLVFDPKAAEKNHPHEAFRCRPLREAATESAQDIIRRLGDPNLTDEALLRQIHRFTNEPFRPHLIARSRPVAYAKAAVLAYLDFLIAWGDSLFRTDDRTSIEEAQRKYEQAERLLGQVPEVLPERVLVAPTCYAKLAQDDRTGENVIDPLVEIEAIVQPESIEAAGAVAGGVPALTPYFCFPGNDRFDKLKATIGDRLMKIRACQNIEGIERTLSLYGNRIDPGLIARAVAAGVSPADVFNELNAPLPRYRFKELIQRAKEVCADAKALGQALLSSLEKKDSENHQQLRGDLELTALRSVRQTKQKQLAEAQKANEAAEAAKAPVEARKTFYGSREYMNAEEKSAASLSSDAAAARTVGGAAGLIAQAATGVPDFVQAVHAQAISSGTSTHTKLGGGSTAAQVFQAVQAVANFTADVLGTLAGNAREQGSFKRRSEDWALQADLAAKELDQLEKQAAASALRATITQIDLDNHEQQITHAETTRDFLRSKFTNAELYGWMAGRLAGLYYEQFRLAYDMVLQAQRAWQYELGTDERVVMGSPWDPGKKGLLAADELIAQIHQLEVRFDQKKPYDHAKSPDIRLSEVDPKALIQLRNTGRCEFTIPEEYFDAIEPGGCFRRWRAMAVTIPCVRGPSAVLDGRLTLLAHGRREGSARSGEITMEVGGRDYIELTHGNRDFGLPEGATQEGWRLPFEGTGAVSKWRLELPIETNTFDRRSLTDVVLHGVYTSRNGSPEVRATARTEAKNWPRDVMLDIAALFPEEWQAFKSTGVLDVTLRPEHFPRTRAGKDRRWAKMQAYVEVEEKVRALKVTGSVNGDPLPQGRWKLSREIGAIDSGVIPRRPAESFQIQMKLDGGVQQTVASLFVGVTSS